MIPQPLQEQLDNLALFPDRAERIEALIALGDEYRTLPVPAVPRDEVHRVKACESEVYVDAVPEGDGLRFQIAVDNPQGISAMALARILDEGLSGQPIELVQNVPDDLVYTIFGNELSMGKSAGLIGIIQSVKLLAARHQRNRDG